MGFRSRLGGTSLIAALTAVSCGSPNYVIVHNPVVTVRLTPALDTIPFKGSVPLQITTLDVNGQPTIPDHHPVWASLNTSVLLVDTLGDVSSVWYGSATIRAVVDGVEGDATIVVLAPRVTKVTLASPTPRVERGDTVKFQVSAIDEALLPVQVTGARWSVTDSTKLRIDSTGRAVSVGVGTVMVRVSFAGLADSTTESVLVPATSVALAPDTLTVADGVTDSFQVTIRDSVGNVLTDRPVAVSASSLVQAPQFVAAPASYVPVRGLSVGTGTVVVSTGHVRDTAAVTVTPAHYLSFTSAVAGGAFTCALTTDSAAYCWGWGHAGELGTGDTVSGPQPRLVTGGLKFVSLTAGSEFACGLAAGGAAYCWGQNATQQLGSGGGSSLAPTAVSGGYQFTSLDAHFNVFGDSTSGGVCGLAVGGQAYCWGSGWGGTPVAVGAAGLIDHLALGVLGYCGYRSSDSAAYCWSSSATPTRLAGWDTLPLALQDRGSWSVSCGVSRSALYCGGMWPDTTGWKPMTLSPSTPVTINGLVSISPREAAAGLRHVCADIPTGLLCRGDNALGQLGTTTGAAFVDGLIGVSAVLPQPGESGLEVGWSHSCTFGGDGLLYCWGDNSKGQVGSSGGTTILTPERVLGQPPTP